MQTFQRLVDFENGQNPIDEFGAVPATTAFPARRGVARNGRGLQRVGGARFGAGVGLGAGLNGGFGRSRRGFRRRLRRGPWPGRGSRRGRGAPGRVARGTMHQPGNTGRGPAMNADKTTVTVALAAILAMAASAVLLHADSRSEAENHRRVMLARAQTALDALAAGIRAQGRMGRYRHDRLSLIFEELAAAPDVSGVVLRAVDGVVVASGGETARMDGPHQLGSVGCRKCLK